MRKLWKKSLFLGIIGLILGVFISIIFLIMFEGIDFFYDSTNTEAIIKQLVAGGLLGLFCNGSSVVYEIEEWSITMVTLTHFLVSMTAFYAAGFNAGWFVFGDIFFWVMTVSAVLAYVMIWIIQYLHFRREVKSANEKLKKLKKG